MNSFHDLSNHHDIYFKYLIILHASYASIKLTSFLKGGGRGSVVLSSADQHKATHLINKQPDLVPHLQAAVECSYMQHIPSSNLRVLHCELSFLRVKGETNEQLTK